MLLDLRWPTKMEDRNLKVLLRPTPRLWGGLRRAARSTGRDILLFNGVVCVECVGWLVPFCSCGSGCALIGEDGSFLALAD